MALKTISRNLLPSQAAVNFSTKLKYEAAAVGTPYTQRPSLNQLEEPWAPRNEDVGRAIEADNARQERYGVKKQYPTVAYMALAPRRPIWPCSG